MTCCSCGAALERSSANRRGRLGGDLLEYCPCVARCGSTTTVIVEACGHGTAVLSEDGGPCECLLCGHRWTQHGGVSSYERTARVCARSAVESLAGRVLR